MKSIKLFVIAASVLLAGASILQAQDLAIRVSHMIRSDVYDSESSDDPISITGYSAPLHAVGRCAPDVVKITVEDYVTDDSGTKSLADSYTLKQFHAGNTTFEYRMAQSLGNLIQGTNAYTFTAYHRAGGTETRIVTVSYDPLGYEKGPPPVPPALPGQSYAFAKMTAGGLETGSKYPGTNDESTFRTGLNFFVRADGSVLKSQPGQPPWVYVEPFESGVAVVLDGDRETGEWLVIDPQGKVISHLAAPPDTGFIAGLGIVPTSHNTFDVIDLSGRPVFSSQASTESGQYPLFPKTLVYGRVDLTTGVFLLPSGKELGIPKQAQIGVYQDAQGKVYRGIYEYDDSKDQTTLRFSDESGATVGQAALLGLAQGGGFGTVGVWDPDTRVVAARFEAKDMARTYGIDVTGTVRYMLPSNADVEQIQGRYALMSSGTIPFSFDTVKGDFAAPFRPDAEWLDASSFQALDPGTGRFQVVSLELNKTFLLPPGKRALWRSGDWLCLGSFDPSTASPVHHRYYAKINDARVRLRSAPTLTGAVLFSLSKDTELWIDGLGSQALTIDGYRGYWVHVEADAERGIPAGWVFSRYVEGIGHTDDQ